MKELDKRLFKVAILNDLIGLELSKIDTNSILNPIAKSKLRNLKKSTDVFTSFVDKSFKVVEIQEAFGDFCDKIDELISESINEQLKDL